jgi:hypothetical protein
VLSEIGNQFLPYRLNAHKWCAHTHHPLSLYLSLSLSILPHTPTTHPALLLNKVRFIQPNTNQLPQISTGDAKGQEESPSQHTVMRIGRCSNVCTTPPARSRPLPLAMRKTRVEAPLPTSHLSHLSDHKVAENRTPLHTEPAACIARTANNQTRALHPSSSATATHDGISLPCRI